MTIHLSLKIGAATALAVWSLGSAQAAAELFATYGNANGIVVDGIGTNQDPVNQRNLFLGALDQTQIKRENFDAHTLGAIALGTPVNVFGGAASLTATDAETIKGAARVRDNPYGLGGGTTFLGRFNTTGDPQVLPSSGGPFSGQWWESSARTNTIQFLNPVWAFGLFLTDLGDFDGSLEVAVSNSQGDNLLTKSLMSAGSNAANGSLSFFGYVADESFDKLVFTLNQKCDASGCDVGTYDFIGFDDLITGPLKQNVGPTPVPEPKSLALVGLSLGLMGFLRRGKTST